MRVDLRKFFEAYEGLSHQLAAVDMLARELPPELLDKFCEWIECFEEDGEVCPLPECTPHKGYNIDMPWYVNK